MLIVEVPTIQISLRLTRHHVIQRKKKYGTACNNSPAISLCRIRHCLDHIQVEIEAPVKIVATTCVERKTDGQYESITINRIEVAGLSSEGYNVEAFEDPMEALAHFVDVNYKNAWLQRIAVVL